MKDLLMDARLNWYMHGSGRTSLNTLICFTPLLQHSVGKVQWVTGPCRAYLQWTSRRSLRLPSPASQTTAQLDKHSTGYVTDRPGLIRCLWPTPNHIKLFQPTPVRVFCPSPTRQTSWMFGCRNTLGCCFHHGDPKRAPWKDISTDLQGKGRNTNRDDKRGNFRLAHGWVWSPEQPSIGGDSRGRMVCLSCQTLDCNM